MVKVFDPSKFEPDTRGESVRKVPYLDLNDGTDGHGIDFLFTRGDDKYIARGNIQVVKGREKTGKSAFGIALIVSALSGGFLGLEPTRGDLKVLWIDTEQDKGTLRERAKSALSMASEDTHCDRLSVVPLKGEATGDRLELTLQAIREVRPDFVFLDGVVDLCEDSNDNKESRKVVEGLVRITEECECAILGVLHTNKKDDEARGHLGTIAQQKGSEIYEMKKSNTGAATVEQSLSRFASSRPITFMFGDNFTLTSAEGEPTDDDKRKDELSNLFMKIFDGHDKIRKCDLIKKLILYDGRSKSTAKRAIEDAERLNVIIKESVGNSVYYSYFANEFPTSDAENESDGYNPPIDNSDI